MGLRKYVRDAKGRFARTGSKKSPAQKAAKTRRKNQRKLKGAARRQYIKGQVKDVAAAAVVGAGTFRGNQAIQQILTGQRHHNSVAAIAGAKAAALTYGSARLKRNGLKSKRKRLRV